MTISGLTIGPTTKRQVPSEPSSERRFAHGALFFFMVLLPAVFTALLPVAWTTLTREQGVVTATTRKHLLLVIPYSWDTVASVTSVELRTESGSWTRSQGRYGRSEDKASILLVGRQSLARVPVDAESAQDAARLMDDFLRGGTSTSVCFFTYADRTFSLIAGGLVTLVAVSYLLLWGLRLYAALRARGKRAAEIS
jgi:hypothetical protein